MTKFVILLYHGVTNKRHSGIQNCSKKHISAEDFQFQMEYLDDNFTVLSLSKLLFLKRKGTLPPDSISVTFDDGFANNYSVAFPILKKHGVPATFYLATGFINTNRVFWVDKIEYLLNETSESAIELKSIKKTFSLATTEEKICALRTIKGQLKMNSCYIDSVLQELEQKVGVYPKYNYKDYAMLSWDNVRAMNNSDICEFGAHTVDHVILSHLSNEEKQYQIYASKMTLEQEIQQDVTLFSYPEGQKNQFDFDTIKILRKTGFTSSPTAIFGTNSTYISNFRLYRNMVGFIAPFEKCVEREFHENSS